PLLEIIYPRTRIHSCFNGRRIYPNYADHLRRSAPLCGRNDSSLLCFHSACDAQPVQIRAKRQARGTLHNAISAIDCRCAVPASCLRPRIPHDPETELGPYLVLARLAERRSCPHSETALKYFRTTSCDRALSSWPRFHSQ